VTVHKLWETPPSLAPCRRLRPFRVSAPAITVPRTVVGTVFSDATVGSAEGFVLPFCGEENRVDRDIVATQYSLQSHAVTVFLGPGAGFPDPVTGITIGFVEWQDQGKAALIQLTPPNQKGSTSTVGTGVSVPIGQIGQLSYQVDFAGFTPDGFSVTIMSV
jgi:hypothetical protein